MWGALGFSLTHAMQKKALSRGLFVAYHQLTPIGKAEGHIALSDRALVAAIDQALSSERPRKSLGRELKGFGPSETYTS